MTTLQVNTEDRSSATWANKQRNSFSKLQCSPVWCSWNYGNFVGAVVSFVHCPSAIVFKCGEASELILFWFDDKALSAVIWFKGILLGQKPKAERQRETSDEIISCLNDQPINKFQYNWYDFICLQWAYGMIDDCHRNRFQFKPLCPTIRCSTTQTCSLWEFPK